VLERVARRGYLRGWDDWGLGENLGWGQRAEGTPAATVLRWMLSPEHRANMLDPAFTDVGIGVTPGAPLPGYRDEDAAAYVLDFAVRVAPPVVKPKPKPRGKRVKRAGAKHRAPRRRIRLPEPLTGTLTKETSRLIIRRG
jgi:hypothetical protein